MTCLKQGIKAVQLTSVMRTFPDAVRGMTHTHLTEVRSRATWGALRVARRGSSRTTTTVGHCRARCALGAPKAKRDDKDEAETTAERTLCTAGRKRSGTKANESGTKPTRRHERVLRRNRERNVDS